MSWLPTSKKKLEDNQFIDTIILPRTSDIGNFEVHRALPSKEKQMVGPFIFWDQMGPGEFLSGTGLDVRPHPHIGLSTITYLFKGTMDHKDSLGNDVRIRPGDINLMSAGRGIVHSERTGQDIRQLPTELFGIQSWIAQPKKYEESKPLFQNVCSQEITKIDSGGVHGKVLFGELDGLKSSIESQWATLYLDVIIEAKNKFNIPPTYAERAIYIISGDAYFDDTKLPLNTLIILKPSINISLKATKLTRLLVLGGEPMDGPRYIYWNFVSSRKDQIEDAKNKWLNGNFPLIIDDKEEFIPLP
jgi:redox-sensitive bicupin YhaK (pirin superfamily)